MEEDIRRLALDDQRELRLRTAITALRREMKDCGDEDIRKAMQTTLSFMEECLRDMIPGTEKPSE